MIGRKGLDGKWKRPSDPHTTEDVTILVIGYECFNLQPSISPRTEIARSVHNIPESHWSEYFKPLDVSVHFVSKTAKQSNLHLLQDPKKLQALCDRPNGFADDLDYIGCTLWCAKAYFGVEYEDGHELDTNWNTYKASISYSQPASPRGPAQSASAEPLLTYILRVGRIDPRKNTWKTTEAIHRPDDVYVFMMNELGFDYRSISKPDAPEKPPLKRLTSRKTEIINLVYYTSLKASVQIGSAAAEKVFTTLKDLGKLKEACDRTEEIESDFDYTDCIVEYIGTTGYVVGADTLHETWGGIVAKRKKDLEAQEAKKVKAAEARATKALGVQKPLPNLRPKDPSSSAGPSGGGPSGTSRT
ncbi:hypothetical protein F5880DRAFT_1100799 [Lentinula raphanica]|nr:hypothetical protein F5880DRAFT_1100799 [Lentinula raphanica]